MCFVYKLVYVCKRFDMDVTVKGVEWGVLDCVRCGTAGGIGQMLRMGENEFVKRVCEGQI